ncbi:MAG: DUF4037 domain-containing protein [Firmicutes bacterium]|nr:DUF4037 domain-containing protein [Bacillota bacterium]
MIKGLTLSQRYYESYMDMLLKQVPALSGRIAAGLVGEGSQCFGYDDQFSQDHDFAPGFCIWLAEEDFQRYGKEFQNAYDQLPSTFLGFSKENILAQDRLGVMSIGGFYSRFTGSKAGVPATPMDWLFTSETALAAATNGQVFQDDTGQFTQIRNKLLEFYPEDVRRKKIASRAAVMSQAGQYNLLRVIKRQDKVAALLALSRFTEAALSMVYLLNRRYMPFYKWAYRGLEELASSSPLAEKLLPHFGLLPQLSAIMHDGDFEKAYSAAFETTEAICHTVATELNCQGISQVHSDFLQDHLGSVMSTIKDPQLGSLPPMVDCPF